MSDDDGIPYCKKQTDYHKMTSLNLKERFPNEFEKMLTCFRCEHYQKDDCYFPRSEIDLIEKDRQDLSIHCVFCGAKIHRIFSVLMSMYYKDRYHVNIPIICCSCYSALNDNSFYKSTQRRMIFIIISFLLSLYFLFTYFYTILAYQTWGLVIFFLPFAFWGYISYKDAKSIYYLYVGRKYYKDVLGKASEPTQAVKAEKTADNSDNVQPNNHNRNEDDHLPSGAYNSPGYDY